MQKSFHTDLVKKTIIIKTDKEKVWKYLSDIVGLPKWVSNVKKTVYVSKKKRGVGAVRKIIFDDANVIEEHVISWNNGHSFSYIAVNGLPLRTYFATISIEQIAKKRVRVTWQSYFNSKKMTKKAFTEFVKFLESFYAESLQRLKGNLEVSIPQHVKSDVKCKYNQVESVL